MFFKGKDSSGSIYLTQEQHHVSVCGIQKTAATFMKMKFCLSSTTWSMPMPPSSPALRSHEMKISQPGEQINSELCHAIFVSHYRWFLFIPAKAPQNWSKSHRHWVHLCQRLKKFIRGRSGRNVSVRKKHRHPLKKKKIRKDLHLFEPVRWMTPRYRSLFLCCADTPDESCG